MRDWWIYKGAGEPTARLKRLADREPPWRSFDAPVDDRYVVPTLDDPRYAVERNRGRGYLAEEAEIDRVNAAILLRRPLLVTGEPGVGKSTLAFSIACDLDLGPVLHWPVTSRSTLRDALYRYDAIRRLEDANLKYLDRARRESAPAAEVVSALPWAEGEPGSSKAATASIGNYLQLGPLGTGFLPTHTPRVVLIDEIDKSDLDLPGDLLTLLEDGGFEIPELNRMARHAPDIEVGTHDHGAGAVVTRGAVACKAFPIIVLTSNGEREFPPAFLRRCVRLTIGQPNDKKLRKIIESRMGGDGVEQAADLDGLLEAFLARRAKGEVATDQLLNAVQLRLAGAWTAAEEIGEIADATMHHLSGPAAT
jgi:MoxR-like ATPase